MTPSIWQFYTGYAALAAIVAGIFTGLLYLALELAAHIPDTWLVVYAVVFVAVAIGLRRYRAYKVVPVDE